MNLVLKVIDGLGVQTSYLDSSNSNVYLDSSHFFQVSLFDSNGNEFLTIVSPLNP